MLDPDLPLRRVKTAQSVYYLSPARIETWKAENKVFTVESALPDALRPGNSVFDASRARELGLASAFYDSKAALADALKLTSQSLSEDWLVGKQPVVWRIDVTGTLNKASVDSLKRRLSSALGRGANFLILNLDSEGGDTTHVGALADDLRQLRVKNGSHLVKKIAYVPPGRALGAACYLAVACDEIVMGSGSALADFNYLAGEKSDALEVRRQTLLPLLKEKNYPVPLFEAALTRNLTLVRARVAGGDIRLVTEPQFKENQESNGAKWDSLGRIAPGADQSLAARQRRPRPRMADRP